MSQEYRVIKSYDSPYTEPLTMRKGERLRWEPRECEWPGWIWCTTEGGKSRWVPGSWVQKDGEHCLLRRDYTATELSVEEGETVTVLLVESGWGCATNESGQSGWVALECVDSSWDHTTNLRGASCPGRATGEQTTNSAAADS